MGEWYNCESCIHFSINTIEGCLECSEMPFLKRKNMYFGNKQVRCEKFKLNMSKVRI